MTDPWRLYQPMAPRPDPPEPLPPRLAKLAALTESIEMPDAWKPIEPEELPEVAALIEHGWRYLDDDTRYALLPAIWPLELRSWLPDRRPKIDVHYNSLQPARIAPAAQSWETRRLEQEVQDAARAGFPPPPPDRIWFLKSPWPWLGLKMLLQLIDRRTDETTDEQGQGAFARTAANLLQWDDSRLRSWWTGDQADASHAWESQGRIGEDVVELVCCAIGPVERLLLSDLTDDQVVRWCHSLGLIGAAAVERTLLWRSLDFPAEPPPNLYRFHDREADEIRTWVHSGFSVPDMIDMLGITVAEAISWRDLGFSAARVRHFLNADDAVTAAEVDAFRRAEIAEPRLTEWIEYGFAADDAAAYDELGIQPNEARVWRSRGLGPADVVSGRRLPSGDERGGWAAPVGTPMRDVEHSVPDPPGTRGHKAAIARQHIKRRRGYRPEE